MAKNTFRYVPLPITASDVHPQGDSIGMGLLGQSGFFENCVVEFRHCDKTFSVETL
jgi:hypothetical protein